MKKYVNYCSAPYFVLKKVTIAPKMVYQPQMK